MKTKTFLFTVIVLFLILGISGCKKDDNEICTFNVDDPVNDLEWLKDKISIETDPRFYIHHGMHQNIKNPKKYFFSEEVQLTGGGQQKSQADMGYNYTIIYNCKGDLLLRHDSGDDYTDEWNNFFTENVALKQIWPIIY